MPFDVTPEELTALMRLRGDEAVGAVEQKFGGYPGMIQRLKTDEHTGLSGDPGDIAERKEHFGENSIPASPSKSLLELMWEAIQDVTLIILITAAVVSLILSLVAPADEKPDQQSDVEKSHHNQEGGAADEAHVEWIESVAILISVVVVVLVTALNDWSKEKQFRGLQSRIDTEHKISVLRGGQSVEVLVSELVVGDIVQVKYGDLLPADGFVIHGNDLRVDESSLTGESDMIRKSPETDPVMLSGTHVMEGRGIMVVTAVGLNSQTGIIFKLLGAAQEHKKDKPPANRADPNAPGAEGMPLMPVTTANNNSNDVGNNANFSKPPRVVIHDAANNNNNNNVAMNNLAVSNNNNAAANEKQAAFAAKDAAMQQAMQADAADEAEGGENRKDKSVLQAKLTKLAVQIGKIGTLAATLCVLILFVKFCIYHYGVNKEPFKKSHLNKFVKFIIIGVTVLVVAVPEGLPLAVTLSLAFSVKKMLADNNLVRHLDACETMGNATAICSDKTGTLTTNRMTSVQFYAGGQHFKKIPKKDALPAPVLALLPESICTNTSYTTRVLPPKEGEVLPTQVGNKTECALLGFVNDIGLDFEAIRKQNPDNKFVKVYTFHSGRKAMATLINPQQNKNIVRVHVKGASERVVTWCKWILDENGQPRPFSKADSDALIRNVIENMANDGLRTIGIAYKDVHLNNEQVAANEEVGAMNERVMDIDVDGNEVEVDNWLESEKRVFSNLTLLGVAGIEDPVRDEVPDAIKKCQRAGITVRMVTGDNINTARSIAQKCGIIKPGDDAIVLEGPDFNQRVRDSTGKVQQALIDKVWPTLRVMARSQPQDKYILVKGIIDSKLSQHREVVAVTGDGTNDGPALKKADVGFAMGITGTDVAKEASDIVLTDDNFTSIVKAVMWGRNVYDSIAKFLQFQLTVNVVAVCVALLGAVLVEDTPLKAVQMLWVNLIMDTFASLALATEPPTEDLLNRKPYGRTKPLISRTMFKNIAGQSIYQLTLIICLLYFGPRWFGFDSALHVEAGGAPTVHYTFIYNTFVFMTLFNEINARKIHGERNVFSGIFRNRIFVGIWVLQVAVQVALICAGGWIGQAMQTTALSLEQWAYCIAFGLGTLVWQQLVTSIPTHRLPKLFAIGKDSAEFDPEVQAVMGHHTGEVGVDGRPKRSGQVLWVRSLTRLQQQLQVVRAFRTALEEIEDRRSTYSNPALYAARGGAAAHNNAFYPYLLRGTSRTPGGGGIAGGPFADICIVDESMPTLALNASARNLTDLEERLEIDESNETLDNIDVTPNNRNRNNEAYEIQDVSSSTKLLNDSSNGAVPPPPRYRVAADTRHVSLHISEGDDDTSKNNAVAATAVNLRQRDDDEERMPLAAADVVVVPRINGRAATPTAADRDGRLPPV